MSKIVWDATGDRLFETGVSNAVLYVANPEAATPGEDAYMPGVPWNGITAISESPSGAEASPLYADNIKYLSLTSAEEFGASIEAFTYPDEFGACDGTAALSLGVLVGQQSRVSFGLCYKTLLGNDVAGDAYGYKLHIIYGAKAAPSERAYATVNDSPEAITFSWEVTTTPVEVPGAFKPTSSIVIDSTKVLPEDMAAIEAMLYGVNADALAVPAVVASEPKLPTPTELLELITTTVAG